MSGSGAAAGEELTSAVFGALADPTRRALVESLAGSGEATATQLAVAFPMTRQAVAKHLSALATAGLVTRHRVGREQRYHLEPQALSAAVIWMERVGGAWDERLAALRGHLARRSSP